MPSSRQQTLAAPPVPTLPDPGAAYSDRSVRSSNSLVRTFMLRLTGALQSLFGPGGGQYVDFPNALFFNTAEQMFAAANTAYPVVYNNTYLNNLISLQSGSTSRVEVSTAGVYNFQYTGQLLSENSSAKEIAIWIRKNGTDIGYSSRVSTIETNGHYAPISWSFNINMDVGDYLEIMAAVTNADLHLHAEVAASPRPGTPSSVLSVNYMSALPETIPTPP
jgi:hypothetical protein